MRALEAGEQIPRKMEPRVEIMRVPSAWLVQRWGPPLIHEDEGLKVDWWAFQLDDGTYVSLEHVPEMDTMMLYSDSPDILMLRTVTGLLEFESSACVSSRSSKA